MGGNLLFVGIGFDLNPPLRGANSHVIENTKFEYRKAKQIRKPNIQMSKAGKTKAQSLIIITN
jgi:hypothetical protein